MKGYSPIFASIIIASMTVIMAWPVYGQDSFGVDDAAASAGYRGYTTYREQTQNAPRHRMVQDTFQPEPLINQRLYDPNQQERFERAEIDILEHDKPTRLEEFYRERTNEDDLGQYGYDLFYTPSSKRVTDKPNNENVVPTVGAVQDSYVLKSGDTVEVVFTGERRGRETYTITSDGRLIIDGLNPLSAAGKSFAALKNDLSIMAQDMQYRGSIDISVTGIRQIGVLVAGHVHKPGRQNLDAHQSVLDALNVAGGVRKSGSLRSIKIIRGGQSHIIDLYDFIVFQNASQAMQLQDGDRIIIPPIGPTFAVTGDVKQAGIFELKSHFGKTRPENMQGALTMAGGVLGGGDLEFSLKRADGNVVNLRRNSQATINDGAILTVMRATDRLNNAIEVKGYSRKNGLYDLNSAGTLYALMGDRRLFGDDTYPLMGVISRVKRDSLTRHLMGFSPQSIALGHDDRQLEAGDIIYLFSNDDIAEILENNKVKNITENNKKNKFPQAISNYILDNVITIQGAVRNEGEWPVGTVTDLQTIISVAGGLTSRASRSDIEITSRHYELGNTHRRRNIDVADIRLSDVMLEAGDQVRVNERFDQAVEKTVRITGEVRNPGAYDLMRGDTLLSLIDRAGGLTMDAYPPAAVFSRKAERKREEQKFRTAAQELERTVSVNLNAVDKGANLTPAQISMARKLADDLRAVQAVGRVTVEADPAVLSVRPELDMLLEDGDHLHVPKRTLNVRVAGEVMNPASLLFMDDKDVSDYLREAGGKSYYADSDRIFVVYPDGSAQPVRGSGWGSDKPAMVIPGSTIIVPRDPKPFSFMDSFKDITQILTNMAITGVFVEDIANDEN